MLYGYVVDCEGKTLIKEMVKYSRDEDAWMVKIGRKKMRNK